MAGQKGRAAARGLSRGGFRETRNKPAFDQAANSLVAVRRMGVWRRVPRKPQLHAQGVCQVMFALPRAEGAPPSDWRRAQPPPRPNRAPSAACPRWWLCPTGEETSRHALALRFRGMPSRTLPFQPMLSKPSSRERGLAVTGRPSLPVQCGPGGCAAQWGRRLVAGACCPPAGGGRERGFATTAAI